MDGERLDNSKIRPFSGDLSASNIENDKLHPETKIMRYAAFYAANSES
jgi:hypothetical protein